MSGALAVSFGGGANSVAMLAGFYESGIRPDLILFSDPKAEFPETYETLAAMNERCAEWGFPPIQTVFKTYKKEHEGLEAECLRKKMLPGLAYGKRSCSIKHKGDVLDKHLKSWAKANGTPLPVRKAIGYDASEPWRAGKVSGKPELWTAWYPLVEWGWDREACVAKSAEYGIAVSKSSCFFCPAMKKGEIIRMAEERPELMERALAIEEAAAATTRRGLGGKWRWTDLLKNDRDTYRFDLEGNVFLPCGCVD